MFKTGIGTRASLPNDKRRSSSENRRWLRPRPPSRSLVVKASSSSESMCPSGLAYSRRLPGRQAESTTRLMLRTRASTRASEHARRQTLSCEKHRVGQCEVPPPGPPTAAFVPASAVPRSRPGPATLPSRAISRVSPAWLSLMRRAHWVDDDETHLAEDRGTAILAGPVDTMEDRVGRWELRLELAEGFQFGAGCSGEGQARDIRRDDLGQDDSSSLRDQVTSTLSLEETCGRYGYTFCV